jgi:hypothetical protein
VTGTKTARTIVRGLAIGVALASTPAFAQAGLSGAAGGVIVILFAGALALLGLGVSVTGGVMVWRGGRSFWSMALLLGGILAMSPALLLVTGILLNELKEAIPVTQMWDFSASRSVSVLDPLKRRPVDGGPYTSEYTYQGTLCTTIRLPADRLLSGEAWIMYLRANKDQVTLINWRTRGARTNPAFHECKRIMRELKLNTDLLDDWHAKILRGEKESFSAGTSDADPDVRVSLRWISSLNDAPLPLEQIEWMLQVEVEWKDGER